MLGMVVTLRVMVTGDNDDALDDNFLDEVATQIETGIEAIEQSLFDKYPNRLDRIDVEFE